MRIAALNTGDCFDLVNKDEEIGWNTYVQYRACDLLHDGEVFTVKISLILVIIKSATQTSLIYLRKLVIVNFLFIRTQQSFQTAMRFNIIGIQSPKH